MHHVGEKKIVGSDVGGFCGRSSTQQRVRVRDRESERVAAEAQARGFGTSAKGLKHDVVDGDVRPSLLPFSISLFFNL